jgi:hypothetical protein
MFRGVRGCGQANMALGVYAGFGFLLFVLREGLVQ